MSRKETWFSKEDVLKDIGVVAGRFEDVEDEFIVRGERPPPPRRIEDEDMKILFGDVEPPIDSEQQGPDLQGISYMLQMVNEYEENCKENSEISPDEIVTISKLNPNVPEFVPKPAATSSPSNNKNIVSNKSDNYKKYKNVVSSEAEQNKKCKSIVNNDSNSEIDSPNTNKVKSMCNKTKDCKDINVDKRIDIATLKPEEITDITKKLRNEISNSSSETNWQGKRKRNVAIAALLKLYSANSAAPSPTPASEGNKTPILYTPEYFERCTANASLEATKAQVSKEDSKLPKDNSVPLLETKETNKDLKVNTAFSNEQSSSISSLESPAENQLHEDPEIRESIQKVNSWFEKPVSPKRVSPKPKGPVLFLGPIPFKKKVNQKPCATDESKRSTPSSSSTYVVSEFVPSTYANELTQMYSERKKVLERKELDIWEKAELEMKAKEAKLKENLEKSRVANAAQDDSDDRSRQM